MSGPDEIQLEDIKAVRSEGGQELRALMRAQIAIGRSRRDDKPKPRSRPRPVTGPAPGPPAPARPARHPTGRSPGTCGRPRPAT